jgi:hypothetical protein
MSLWQRTVVRIGLASALLAVLIIRFLRFGYPIRTELLFAGGTLAIGGLGSLIIRPFLYKAAPNIDEQLKPVWGYGLPMRMRVPLLIFMTIVGLGIIAWAMFGLKA